MKLLFSLFFSSLLCFASMAQDTDWVQTFTFDDITKRRGSFKTVAKKDYRKILMYYTLKCDPKTTQDRFNCGEWDYLTYNFLYDHNATFDSTYNSSVNYTLNGATPEDFSYTTIPVYDNYAFPFEKVFYLDTISYRSGSVGNGVDTLTNLIPNANKSNVSQFIYTASELSAAGLNSGEITGLKFIAFNSGKADLLTVALKNVPFDTLTWQNRVMDAEVVFNQPYDVKASDNSLRFTKPFIWNGNDNILVQFEVENHSNNDLIQIKGHSTNKNQGIAHSNDQSYLRTGSAGNLFNGYANMGKDVQIDGGNHRTIELWANAFDFNNGGLFQAGLSGTLRDWSLRTMGTDNEWRIQLWGADGDVTLTNSKYNWQHYALVYDGKATKLYYNGEFIRQKNEELNTPDANLLLGRWQGNNFSGNIDNVRVWEKALTPKMLKEYAYKPVDTFHTQYEHLKAVYSFDKDSSLFVGNDHNKGEKGVLHGLAWRERLKALTDYLPGNELGVRPDLTFEQGLYNTVVENNAYTKKVLRRPYLMNLYGNEANGRIIDDNAKKHPSIITDTLAVWQGNVYAYTYNVETGAKIDSTFVTNTNQIKKINKEWYSPTVRYEIGRYITPYGINLSLGPKGFTWVYDVTDYAPLLFDSIDISAGNQQELIDLKIAYIKGTPPQEVKRIDAIWPFGSYSFRNLDNDNSLSETELELEADAETFVVRTRLTGHGHNSTNGEFPHCCEWKDNTHYLFVDGNEVADWKIWREDCDLNPVYPQGGNWVGAREGWCPGDVVGDNDFNITSNITGNSVKLDYDITPVPSDNAGMGGGNYRVAMQLFQYGEASFENDASIEMVKRPTNWEYYQRINPACAEPIITIKNTGSEAITSLKVEYRVSGGTKLTHTWSGNLDFLKSTDINLPIDGSYFWVGDNTNVFSVKIVEVNGAADENGANDLYESKFEMPEIFKKEPFFIQLKTNNVPEENRYEIKDATGEVVYSKSNLTANTIYRDTIDLPHGCYTLEFFDEGYGLSYWAWPDQGSGTLQLRYVNRGLIKSFNPDFGEKIYYPFAVGTVSSILEGEYKPTVQIYPNPSNGQINVEINHLLDNYTVEVYDLTGKAVCSKQVSGTGLDLHRIDLQSAQKGIYLIKVLGKHESFSKKVIVK